MRFDAILELYPNVVTIDQTAGAFDAEGNQVEIDESAVEVKVAELQAAHNAAQYKRDRAAAYPSIQEQLDMQYWDSVNGTTTWADAIAKVKADYPKAGE